MRSLNHPNIVKLKEIIKNKDELFCVYEWCDENLFDWYQNIKNIGRTISEDTIRQ